MDNNAESGSSDNPKTSSNMDTTSMYMMTDIKIFINLLQLVGQCPECSNAITTTVDLSSKKGLVQKVVPSCKDKTGCAWTYSTCTSTMTKNDERSRYDVNIRSIITFGEIRRGLSHIETFHRIMNMSPPYSHSTYDDNEGRITTLHSYHEYGIMKVMERIGLHTGHFNVEASHFAELVQISGVGYKATENVIIRRKKLHAQQKVYDNVNNKDYGAGMH